MKAKVAGLGVWYPKNIVTNAAWPGDFGSSVQAGDRTFNDIPEALGTAASITAQFLQQESCDPFLGSMERRRADDETTALHAESEAALAAIADAGLSPGNIDAVISYSMVPDRLMPGTAGAIAHRLGIERAMAFTVDAACATVIPQLMTAIGLVQGGMAENVLVTQSHLLLRALPMLHPAAPGLGDGATAFVVSKYGRWRVLATHMATHGQFADAVTWVRPEADELADVSWWKEGGNYRLGSRNRTHAKQLMRDTVEFGAQTVREVAQHARIDVERVTHLFSVQPRGWIPGAIARCLGLAPEVAVTTYEKYAHIGACGPIANWHEGYRAGTLNDKSLIALYAQGAGFTRGAALIGMD